MRKPLVAISASTRLQDGVERVRVNQSYLGAIEHAGMVPIVLPPLDDTSQASVLLDAVDGLVLSGGEDVDPACYGAERHPCTFEPHRRRDAWELALTAAARERALPTLAICRGVQMVNVALGGTLVQDIPAFVAGALPHDDPVRRAERIHDVRVAPGSRLALALGATAIRVNSTHHQSVDRVAPGLAAVAAAPDGVIEGVEWRGPGEWWLLGVQWHPEELIGTDEEWDRDLFTAFAGACGGVHAA
jgi:putative glutamine amidotransferase